MMQLRSLAIPCMARPQGAHVQHQVRPALDINSAEQIEAWQLSQVATLTSSQDRWPAHGVGCTVSLPSLSSFCT